MYRDFEGPLGKRESEGNTTPTMPLNGQLTLRMKVGNMELEIVGEAATVNAQYDKVKADLTNMQKTVFESSEGFVDNLAKSMIGMLK